ncbi:MAG TPA: protein phosphatase 2C domain-containing protein [Propionicimonas sp.]
MSVVTSLTPGARFSVASETIELLRPEVDGGWSARSESGRYYLVSEWPAEATVSPVPTPGAIDGSNDAVLGPPTPQDDLATATGEAASTPVPSSDTPPADAPGPTGDNADNATDVAAGPVGTSLQEPVGASAPSDTPADTDTVVLVAGRPSGHVSDIVDFLTRVNHPSLPLSHLAGRHPNLGVQLLFIEYDPDSVWLTSTQLSPSAACRLGGQLAQLASHCHAAGFVLTAVRPEVVRWSALSGRSTVVQFEGLGLVGEPVIPQTWGPATAPEVALGQPATAEMDVFSLGIVLAIGLGLELDEEAATVGSKGIVALDLDLMSLIQRCVAIDASDRPSLQHIARELGRLRGSIDARWAGASSIGRIRDVQEDSWGALTLTGAAPGPAITFAVVADGMGGADAGEVASRLAVRAATAAFCETISGAEDGTVNATLQGEAMAAAFSAASDGVARYAESHPELRSLASTLTAASVVNGQASIVHAGDSRCSLVRAGEIRALTTDHTVAARLLAIGEITEVEAASHPQRSTLYRCLNADRNAQPEVVAEALQDGDWLVLSSDGVHGLVSAERIGEVAVEASVAAAARALVSDAVRAGGYDNATAICVQISATVP